MTTPGAGTPSSPAGSLRGLQPLAAGVGGAPGPSPKSPSSAQPTTDAMHARPHGRPRTAPCRSPRLPQRIRHSTAPRSVAAHLAAPEGHLAPRPWVPSANHRELIISLAYPATSANGPKKQYMTPTSSAVLPIPAGPRTFGAGAPGATGRAAAADSTLLLSDKARALTLHHDRPPAIELDDQKSSRGGRRDRDPRLR
jgi:hypothetical protein